MSSRNLLILTGFVCYLVASLVLWLVLMREPWLRPRDPRREPRWALMRLAKTFTVIAGGALCGGLVVLLAVTVVNAARPGALSALIALWVWVLSALGAALFLARAGTLRRTAARALMTLGFESLALPVAALTSFLVAGARLATTEGGRADLMAVGLGVRLAGSLGTIGLSIGGLGLGLLLVWLGDRARRTARRRPLSRVRAPRTKLRAGGMRRWPP